jgi:hypothetical protein
MNIITRCCIALLAVSALVTLTPCPAVAQIGPGMGQPPSGQQAPPIPAALKKEYDEIKKMSADAQKQQMDFQKTVTPDQQKKMMVLQTKYMKQAQDAMAPYMKKYGKTPSQADQQKVMKEVQPTMMKIQTAAEAELKTLLTPKQLPLFNAMQAKQKVVLAKQMAFMNKMQSSAKK